MANKLVVDGLVEHTPSQLEDKAVELVRRRVDVPDEVPINIELLLEYSQDVHLDVMPNLRHKHNVEGCVFREYMSRDLTVFVDLNIANGYDDARYGEVIGEELAHIELHRGIIEQIDSVSDFVEARKHEKWRRMERDAVQFSTAVRIPACQLTKEIAEAYSRAVSRIGFGDSTAALMMVRNNLARRFEVPRTTMTRRLSQWPFADLGDLVRTSVVTQSDTLLSDDDLRDVQETIRQRMFYWDGYSR